MVNTMRVNADHGRGFNPISVHMTKLRNFTKCENRDFSAFRFSLHSVLEQALRQLIVCLMISHKNYIQKFFILLFTKMDFVCFGTRLF